ncbi:hypothetical protein J6590_058332 [Homalodisca vitripennis]|nr:hypothetical protein J6590_058332 [Homalodisca vitripennis]
MAYSPISPTINNAPSSLLLHKSVSDNDTAVMTCQLPDGLQSYLALQSTMLPRVSYCTIPRWLTVLSCPTINNAPSSLLLHKSVSDNDTAVMTCQSPDGLQSYLVLQSTMLPRVSNCTSPWIQPVHALYCGSIET